MLNISIIHCLWMILINRVLEEGFDVAPQWEPRHLVYPFMIFMIHLAYTWFDLIQNEKPVFLDFHYCYVYFAIKT